MGSCHRHHSAQALLQETGCLISMPEVCLKLRSILRDPDHSMQRVAEVIIHDPSLTTRLLRIVNSAWFGLRVVVRDVSHALAILGEHELYNLVMATSLMRALPSPGGAFDVRAFWQSSVLSAVLARNLALEVELESREEIFIAGLLLNVGKLPLYHREPELAGAVAQLLRERNCADNLAERELLGFDHAEVGACLAKAWNFSDLLVQAIALHHELPAATQSLPCRIAVAAGSLGERLGDPAEDESLLRDCPSELLLRINVDRGMLPEILSRSRQEYQEVFNSFFGLPHGK